MLVFIIHGLETFLDICP